MRTTSKREPNAPHPAVLLVTILWLLPASPAVATDLSGMGDHDLLTSAIEARKNGDCAWALELFRELLQRTDAPRLATKALYGRALCLEETGRWEDAADSYRTLVHRYPESPAAPDALFRLGMVRERQRRFRDAERCYRRILKRYDSLSEPDLRAVKTQLAWEQLLQSRVRRALRGLKRLEDTWDAMAPEDLRDERYYLAKAHVALGAILSYHASTVGFGVPRPGRGLAGFLWYGATGRHQTWLRNRLEEREARIRAAAYHYRVARGQKTAIWISASFFLSGCDHVGHYLALNEAPVPRRLTKDQRQLYREMLAEKTRVYLVSASQRFLKGHEAAVANADDSRWAELLADKVDLVENAGVEALAGDPPSNGAFWMWLDLLMGEPPRR